MNFKRSLENHCLKPENEANVWMRKNQDIFGPQKEREEVLKELRESPELYREYSKLSYELKEELISFCMGIRGMKVTYDPVFKKIMDPMQKPERLEEFLSLCLGQEVEILQVLPSESQRLTDEGSFLVMDILVRLASGDLVNVEIQRIGYLFPGSRCACYSSDLVMRQYSQVREEKGERFSYKDIRNVYTIVLMQKSTSEFRKFPNEYLHYAKQVFNTGLKLNMLQEYLLIPLDIFMENHHNISNKLEAWLCFIASDKAEDIKRVLEYNPEFAELYREVFQFRYRRGNS